MRLYRLSNPLYAHDLRGIGAKKYGARWNSQGVPMLYTAPDPATCMIEFMVHIQNPKFFPNKQVLVELSVPETLATIKRLNSQSLPDYWDQTPGPFELKLLGDKFIEGRKHLILSVPSIPVPKSRNYLVNPLHPEFNQVSVVEITSYPFEDRLMKLIEKKC